VATPFSFHEIVRCEPGVGFHTRDVFVDTEHEVSERSASNTMQVGDSLFGQIVTCDGVSLLEACGPFVVTPLDKIRLIDFRERMKAGVTGVTPENLGDWDLELRGAYLDIADGLLRRPRPQMQNTDGEAFALHRLDFEIESAQRAFDALKHLALDEIEDDLLESAEVDEEGGLRRVALPWKVAGNRVHAEWDNTVLGQLEIDGTRLVVNVNSDERAARILRIVEECLGESARLVSNEVQSLDNALLEAAASEAPEPSDLSEHPEVRERIDQLMRAHYESWVSEKIPALDGVSPLEAVQLPAGREKVKALVDQIERDGAHMQPPLGQGVVLDLRRRLGLG
jgi:hypothetical protein